MLFVGPLVGAGGSFGLRRGWEVKLTGGGGGECCFDAAVVVAALDVATSIDSAFRKLLFSKNKKIHNSYNQTRPIELAKQ